MPRSESKSHRDEEDDEYEIEKKNSTGDSDSKATVESRTHSDEKKGSNGDEAGLVNKVIEYFFNDDDFARVFERFAEENCQIFDLQSEEMKLEYTEIYNQFQALFEEKLEDYIHAQGSTVKEFYQLIREAYEKDRESSTVLCSEILIATADFDVFVMMMKQTKESMLLAKR